MTIRIPLKKKKKKKKLIRTNHVVIQPKILSNRLKLQTPKKLGKSTKVLNETES